MFWEFFLIPNKINKFGISEYNLLPTAWISSAGIWSFISLQFQQQFQPSNS
jgi:hypothetical protein